MRAVEVSKLVGILCLAAAVDCFAPNTRHVLSHRCYKTNPPSTSTSRRSSNEDEQSGSVTVLVVSWDGCIVDTVQWRVHLGIQAALTVWPHLREQVAAYCSPIDNVDDDFRTIVQSEELTWLRNKLTALAPVVGTSLYGTTDGEGHSATCEYALAARLLLEEQALDAGQSSGCTGKYASQFHPRSGEVLDETNDNGSRPLTVGEIAVNWLDGGMIRDTIRTKYHVTYDDPIPILQAAVQSIQTSQSPQYVVQSCGPASRLIHRLHQDATENMQLIIAIDHHSDLGMAQASLEDLPDVCFLDRSQDTLEQILRSSEKGSTMFMIESSWERLKTAIPLFGDNIPARPTAQDGATRQTVSRIMTTECEEVPDRYLSLHLADWSSADPTQLGAATMSPWANTITLGDFEELVNSLVETSASVFE